MGRLRRGSSVEQTFGVIERALTRLTSPFRKSVLPHSKLSSDDLADRIPEEDAKGPLGLNLLHPVEDPLIDFIFIHGLGGGSRKTWSKTSDRLHYWPKEWLPRDPEFSCVRVHSFGYRADWNDKKGNTSSIHEFALSLLADMRYNPDIRRSKTKIVLIAHSMGGLVAKQAYIIAREDPDLRQLSARIHTLYFLATPHRGSDLAKTLLKILRISYEQKQFVVDIERNSHAITMINDTFRHYAADVELWSFYETVPSNLVFSKAIIVERDSATLGYPGERHLPLNADHRGICKFDRTDPNYKVLRNAFVTTIDTILSKDNLKPVKNQHARLVELTGVIEVPFDDLTALEEIWVSGSCKWLTTKPSYISWRNNSDPARRIFCLTGNAGSGKSVLCSQIIKDLQTLGLQQGYFFFKQGKASKYTIASCLLSLAYQMASTDNDVLNKLVELQQDVGSLENWEHTTIWRRLFIGLIFNSPNRKPYFWIIDALDECQKPNAFLELLGKTPSHFRVFVTSRSTPDIEQGFNALAEIERHDIVKEDICEDLNTFVSSKMDLLPVGDDDSRSRLRGKILQKSSVSFLWVSLIVQELQQVYSDEDAVEVLEAVPPDMNGLYSRMLGNVVRNERARDLARSIFTWTLLAARALTLGELQCALRLDVNQTVQNLQKSITAISGQIIWVDHNLQIQYVHQTAKTYLAEQDTYPSLAINEQQGHTRIAEICLLVLTRNLRPGLRARGPKASHSTLATTPEFITYVCVHFSDHVQKCLPENTTICELLCRFLAVSVLHWIEFLAKRGMLHHVSRTAKNLKTYLTRRAKYLAPVSPEDERLELWANDLVRVATRFRTCLSLSPSSIHGLVPKVCPTNSMIFQTYARSKHGMFVMGSVDDSWDECLTRIDFPTQTTTVTYGDRYLAVGTTDGGISVYLGDSIQFAFSLSQGEFVRKLAFSSGDQLLASSGFRRINVWDTERVTLLWEFSTNHNILYLSFIDDGERLKVATVIGVMATWDLVKGHMEGERVWADCDHRSAGQKKPDRAPAHACFSQDETMLAAAYRGLPLYLYDLTTEVFIGCCSTNPGYRGVLPGIDAMAFNPSPEINVIVASYDYGGLAVFDLGSTDLLYEIEDVFAHTLSCSPNGRTLVTGTFTGEIQIFEFGGSEARNLRLIYQIDTYEEGIYSVVFSGDSLRFADIQVSQCRVWEPAVLVRNDTGEGSQSELSQAIPLNPKPVELSSPNKETIITAVCCCSKGRFLLCGKEDGSVASFDTQKAIEDRTLYRHQRGTRIFCISYSEKGNFIMTADETDRILIKSVEISHTGCRITSDIANIRTSDMVISLVPHISGTRFLMRGESSVKMYTTSGDQIWFLDFNSDIRNSSLLNHPHDPDYFLFIRRDGVKAFSWDTESDRDNSGDSTQNSSGSPHITAPALSSIRHDEDIPHYVAFFHAERYVSIRSPTSTVCKVWEVPNLPTSDPPTEPLALPVLEKHIHKIRQIICIVGSFMFFLDTDLWVCTADIKECTSSASSRNAVKRHFVLLQEWQRSDGTFFVEYVPSTNDVVVIRKQGAVVIKGGLDFAETWFT